MMPSQLSQHLDNWKGIRAMISRQLPVRERLSVVVAVEIPFEFADEAEHWAFEALLAKCLEHFNTRFRWGVEPERDRASFGFVTHEDALEFCFICGRPAARSQISWAPR